MKKATKIRKRKWCYFSLSMLLFFMVILFSYIPRIHEPDYFSGEKIKSRIFSKLVEEWYWKSYGNQSGSYIAQRKDDFSCLMLVEEVCYAFNPQLVNILPLGVWYARETFRDLSALDLRKRVCNLYPDLHRKSKRKKLFSGSEQRDLVNIQQNVGHFVSHSFAQWYLHGMIKKIGKDLVPFGSVLQKHWPILKIKISQTTTVVPLRNAHMGHFVEILGGLSEAATHVVPNNTEEMLKLDLFFVGSHASSDWTDTMLEIIFGTEVNVKLRKWEVQNVCFKEILIPLNAMFTRESLSRLRAKIYEYAMSDGVTQQAHAQVSLRTAQSQITLVKRLSSRKIRNFDEVKRALIQIFPNIPLQEVAFEGMSVASQISMMHNTALYVSMHGASMSNVIFLKPNGVVLELFPYKFLYGGYKRLSLVMEQRYFDWHNNDRNRSEYEGNCYDLGQYESLSESECHHLRSCRTCVRDLSTTEVDIPQFEALLGSMYPLVNELVEKAGTDMD